LAACKPIEEFLFHITRFQREADEASGDGFIRVDGDTEMRDEVPTLKDDLAPVAELKGQQV